MRFCRGISREVISQSVLPKFLPHDWKGAFALLAIVWVLSSFLDNIAAALIGGAMAHQLFRAKVHISYLAGIVAASNAGGAFSVVGDTTTTMMWIDGVPPLHVLEAIIASSMALFIFGIPAAIMQQRYSPILAHSREHPHIDWPRVAIVGPSSVVAIATNVTVNTRFSQSADNFPFLGPSVWVAILCSRNPAPSRLGSAARDSERFCLSPLAGGLRLDDAGGETACASWQTAFGLGFLSAVFDNIPLTALALKQGGYDWGFLAFTVGFGGSMVWFGSSAGVALTNLYPEARSVVQWVRHGWFVPLAYVVAFFFMVAVWPWRPDPPHNDRPLRSTPRPNLTRSL